MRMTLSNPEAVYVVRKFKAFFAPSQHPVHIVQSTTSLAEKNGHFYPFKAAVAVFLWLFVVGFIEKY